MVALADARGTKALPKPRVITFTAAGDTLTAVDPNPKEWGSAGLTLTRDLAGGLIGGAWHLTKVVHGNDPPVVPKDPSKYTPAVRRGRHAVAAGGLQPRPRFLYSRPAEAARRACGDHADNVPAWLTDTIFLRDLSAAATFDLDDGELRVTTKDGLATLTFERVR